LNNPDNPLFDLLPPPRDTTIIGLRSAHLLPIPRTCTSKYRSFIHYGLTHCQLKLKSIISVFPIIHIVSVTKTVYFMLW